MLRNITAACLAFVIFTTSSMIALASPAGDKSLMGEITVSGQTANGNAPSVMLNGEAVFSGRTFLSNNTISTPNDVTSTVKLGKLGYIVLNPNTTLNLSFDEKTISGTLSAGQIKVYNAEGIDVKIQNLNNATAKVVPMNTKKDDDDNDGGVFGGSAAGPLLVFAGIVTAVIVIVILNNDNNNNRVVSPTR